MKIFKYISFLLMFVACGKDNVENKSEVAIIDHTYAGLNLLTDGNYAYGIEDYVLPAMNDDRVMVPATSSNSVRPRKINIAGRLYLPMNNLKDNPLVVFLHGNHETCGYKTMEGDPRLDFTSSFSETGVCPSGMIEVPSHLGYEYSAKQLASHGYAVITINANRGINEHPSHDRARDPKLVAARGRLVLRTLEYLQMWQKGMSSPFRRLNLQEHSIDFSNVALIGHSRGGEGVRAAYNIMQIWQNEESQYWHQRIQNLQIKSILEIAPLDFGVKDTEDRQLNFTAQGIPWAMILGACDGDLDDYTGVKVYERMLQAIDGKSKSIVSIWGANHNYFNSEWHVSETLFCPGNQTPLFSTKKQKMFDKYPQYSWASHRAQVGETGSEAQRNITKSMIFAFIQATLKSQQFSEYLRIFDPQYSLPTQVSNLAKMSRLHINDQFSKSVFDGNKNSLEKNGKFTIEKLKTPSPNQILSKIEWGKEKGSIFINTQDGFKVDDFWTLDTVLSVRSLCKTITECTNTPEKLSFSISLIDVNGQESSAVLSTDYNELFNMLPNDFIRQQEIDESTAISTSSVILETMRIELKDFVWQQSPATIKKVKFAFKENTPGILILDEIFVVKSN